MTAVPEGLGQAVTVVVMLLAVAAFYVAVYLLWQRRPGSGPEWRSWLLLLAAVTVLLVGSAVW